jgi:hypothetical protein
MNRDKGKGRSGVDSALFDGLETFKTDKPTPMQKVVPVTAAKEEMVHLNFMVPKGFKKDMDKYSLEKEIYLRELIINGVTEYMKNHP